MRIGVATWLLRGQPLPELARRLADMGFDALSFSSQQYSALRDALGELCTAMAQLNLVATFHLAIPEGAQSEALAQVWRDLSVIEEFIAESGQVHVVSFDPAVWRSEASRTRGFAGEKTALALRAAWQKFAPAGIKIGLENWPAISTDVASWDFVAMVVPEVEFGILLDLGHLNLSYHQGHLGLLDPAAYVAAIPREIVELHVHDNDGRRDSHLFPGDGNTSFGPIFAALAQAGFQGIATLEAAPNAQPMDINSPKTQDRLRTACDWLRARLKAEGIE